MKNLLGWTYDKGSRFFGMKRASSFVIGPRFFESEIRGDNIHNIELAFDRFKMSGSKVFHEMGLNHEVAKLARGLKFDFKLLLKFMYTKHGLSLATNSTDGNFLI